MPDPHSPLVSDHEAHRAALDGARMGVRHYWIWFLASGGTLLDGFSIFLLGVAVPLITDRFALTPMMVGLIGAALVLGAVFGAAAGGPAADRFGRRPAFLVDMAIITVGAFISAFAHTPEGVLVGQFLVGIGIGIDFPVSASYVSETMPKRARSRMVVATIALQSVGLLLGAVTAISILSLRDSVADWRLFLGATGACGGLLLLLRFSLPESPRWLAGRGRDEEAGRVVSHLAPSELPTEMSSSAASATPDVLAQTYAAEDGDARFSVLFSRPYRVRTLLVSVPWFLMDIATYGVGLFTPLILAATDPLAATAGRMAAEFVNARGTGAIDVFLLIGFLLGLWAVPRFGRIHMQIVGFAGMTVGMLILATAVLTGGNAGANVPIVFVGFILFNLAMNAGPNATTFALAPELFPTSVRATASGFAAATAKIGATLGIFVLPQVKENWGVVAVLVMMAVVSVLGAAVTAALARQIREIPEGRSLEEVATIVRSKT